MDNDGIHAASQESAAIDNEENNTDKNWHEESDLSAIAETTSGRRPKGTTFRVGDEVFICHGARKETAGVQFLFYGIN